MIKTCILLFCCIAYNSYGIENKTIVGFDFTPQGKEYLLNKVFNFSSEKLEEYFCNLKIPDQIIGANKEMCTKEYLSELKNNMSLFDAWTNCVGLPDYFFKNKKWYAGFSPKSLFPRPLEYQLKNIQIDRIKFGHTNINCEENRCTLDIELKELVFSLDITVINLHTKKNLKAGHVLYDIKNLNFILTDKKVDKGPSLIIDFSINTSHGDWAPIEFDLEKSWFRIPQKCLTFKSDTGLESIPLGKFLNSPKIGHSQILDIGNTSLSFLIKSASKFVPHLRKYDGLFNLNLTLNQHLANKRKMEKVSEIINEDILNEVLRSVNQGIVEGNFFKGEEIIIPGITIQDIFDYDKLITITSKIEKYIKTRSTKLLGNFSYKGLSWENLLKSFEESRNDSAVLLLQNLKETLKNSNMEDKSEVIQEIDRINSKVESNIKKSASKIKVKGVIEKNYKRSDIVSLKLVKVNNERLTFSSSLRNLFGKKEKKTYVYKSDLALELNFSVINEQLKKMYNLKRFDFCLSGHDVLTCDLVKNKKNNKYISIESAPVIQWDNKKKSHFFEFGMDVSSNSKVENMSLKVYFGLDTVKKNQISIRYENVYNNFDDTALYDQVVNNIMKFISVTNPMIENFIKEFIQDEKFEKAQSEVENLFNSPIDLGDIKIKKVIHEETGIKISLECI